MDRTETDLILHPVRYRILQTLVGRQMKTHEIAEEMPMVPLSSLYRHLKTLSDAGMVQIAETNLVKGIEEKTYTVGIIPSIGKEEFKNFTTEEHQQFFAAYLSSLFSGFSDYLKSRTEIDLEEDRIGFTDVILNVSTEEMDAFGEELVKMLDTLKKNKPDKNKHRQLITFITFPIDKKEQ